jgi:hypothetical protein
MNPSFLYLALSSPHFYSEGGIAELYKNKARWPTLAINFADSPIPRRPLMEIFGGHFLPYTT